MRERFTPPTWKPFLPAVLLAAGLVALVSCAKKAPPKAVPPVPVVTARASVRDVPVTVQAIGNVEAVRTVSVKSQVEGTVQKVYFREGDFVKKGQKLFQIDARPLKEALNQAEAVLAKDTVQMKNQELDARRYEELLNRGMVARQQYDQAKTGAESLKATVEADKASVKNARINLGYASIHSPIDGRTGNLNVHEGNLVKANDEPALVSINQVDPVRVAFSVPQERLPAIRGQMEKETVRVDAVVPGDGDGPAAGRVTFVDNAVDMATGTIRLKGEFPNAGKRLWPGQFVDVTLTLGVVPGAVVVPSQAVQSGQAGKFVYVVKSDQTVELRPVTTGEEADGAVVITKGVAAGEEIVTDGQLRLAPGSKVVRKKGL
ncbi:MAG TPA: efflux RND transporter periplasmic adaptor subunit [Nitrospirota bacterium]|nr:efflux RND transporter periplasmic adaptor subunit [Nitrospirota bacterium]